MSDKADFPSFSKSLFSGFVLDELVFPYPLIDEEEKENLDLILETIRKFSENYVDSAKFDREEKFPEDVINGMKELGLFGIVIPEEYGGFGMSSTAYVRILEELAKVDIGFTGALAVHNNVTIAASHIENTSLRDRYLNRLISGEAIGAFLLTEPDAGSDLANIQKTGVRDGDEWIVNGQSVWTSGSKFSDWGVVPVKTDPQAPRHRNLSYFVFDCTSPGFEVRPLTILSSR